MKKIFFGILLISFSGCLTENIETVNPQSICEDCFKNETVVAEKVSQLNQSGQILKKVQDYIKKVYPEYLNEVDYHNSTIQSYKGTSFKLIWLVSSFNNENKKNAIYLYYFDEIVQIGYKVNYLKNSEGELFIHLNSNNDELYSILKKNNNEQIFELKAFEEQALLTGKNPDLLNANRNLREKKCSFIDNAGICVSGNLKLLNRFWGAGLACLYFGPECAGAIGITCAVKAAIATSQSKCIETFE